MSIGTAGEAGQPAAPTTHAEKESALAKREDRYRVVLEAAGVPAVTGSYSLAVGFGDLLFLSGQAPYDEAGSLRRGSVAEQVRLVLANLDRVARESNGRLAEAVRVGVYLRDLADFDEMDAAYRQWFHDVLPARTTIQSAFRDFDVEMDAVIAVRANANRSRS
jgi:2-iminobutanoate/2-iminopropanoate deaminase